MYYVQYVKSVAARLLVWRIGGQRSYMFEETLQRTMTVGLFGTKPQPHALSHSLTSDAQAVQAPLLSTFALVAHGGVHYASFSHVLGRRNHAPSADIWRIANFHCSIIARKR
jgi:hypothetical protein